MKLNIQLFASVSSSKYDGRYLKLTATETATSIENNTSTIHWKFESIGGSSAYYTIYEYGVYYNGIQLYDGTGGLKNKNYSNHTFPVTKGSVEGDITIEHNADGTAPNVSFAMFGSVYKNKTNQYDLSLPLTTIPRASQPRLSSSNVDMGTTITIYTDRVSTTFTHTIRYAFGNASGTIATNVADSVNWTPSIDLANQIPSAASGYGEIYCDTYSSGTLIGTKAVGIVLNVPSNVVPSVSFTQVQEAGDVPSSWGVYVKTKSRIALAISGSGVYGSAISGYKISYYGGAVLTQSATTSYLAQAGSTTFTGQVTDTRGRSASTPTTINVVDYSNPTISTAQVQRCDADGNIDNNGEYMYISYGASISSCSNKNTPSAVYKVGYRVHNTGNYTYVNLTTNANSYSANGMLFSDGIKAASSSGTKVQFSTSNTYDIQFYVKDYFMEYTNIQSLDTGFDLINFNPSGKSMAIGKVSEANANQELFEVGIDTIIDGDLSVSGIIDGGSTIRAQNPSGETDIICKDQNGNFIYLYANTGYHGIYDNVYGGILAVSTIDGKKQLDGNWNITGSLTATGGWERYSTSEIQIGTWVDGKTLYRKVVQIPQFDTNGITVQTGITNTDFVMIHGSLTRVETGHIYSIDNYLMEECRFNPTNGNLQLWSNVAGVSFTGYIILEYTKQ